MKLHTHTQQVIIHSSKTNDASTFHNQKNYGWNFKNWNIQQVFPLLLQFEYFKIMNNLVLNGYVFVYLTSKEVSDQSWYLKIIFAKLFMHAMTFSGISLDIDVKQAPYCI